MSADDGSIEPRASGPTLRRRFPSLATVSISIRTSRPTDLKSRFSRSYPQLPFVEPVVDQQFRLQFRIVASNSALPQSAAPLPPHTTWPSCTCPTYEKSRNNWSIVP
jgi:hypothetical protein